MSKSYGARAWKSLFWAPKYPMQYFANTTQNHPKTDVNNILRCLYKQHGPFDSIYMQQYQNRMELGPENPYFWPTQYHQMQYFTNDGPETPKHWCKPYIKKFLQIIRTFLYHLYTTMLKSYEDRAQKFPFWATKIPPKCNISQITAHKLSKNWYKQYLSMFLYIIRTFWYYLYTTISKSCGVRARKSPF